MFKRIIMLTLIASLAFACGDESTEGDADADFAFDQEVDIADMDVVPDTTDPDTEETLPDLDEDPDAVEDPVEDVPTDDEEEEEMIEPPELTVTVEDMIFQGPNGGEVSRLKVDPSDTDTIYAVVSDAFFVSIDDGENWIRKVVGDNLRVSTVEVTPDGTVYVGGFLFVQQSTDSGSSWTDVSHDIGVGIVEALEYQAEPSPRLWAGMDAAPSGDPVVYSWDMEGTTWQSHITPESIGEVAINDFEESKIDGEKLFVAYQGSGFVAGGGVFCYDAATGEPIAGCDGSLPDRPFYKVHAYDDIALVAGGHVFGSEYAGVYSTADDGGTWTLEAAGWTTLVAHEAIRLGDGTLASASYSHGIMLADEAGGTWSAVEEYDGFSFMSIAQTGSGRILGGMEVLGVVGKDPDGNWESSSTGIRMLAIDDGCVDPADTGRIIGVSSGLNTGMPLIRNSDEEEWQIIRSLSNPRYSAAYISPSGRWYVAMDGPISFDQDGVWVSDDGGESFTFLGPLEGDLMDHDVMDIYERGGGDELFVSGNHFSPANPLIMHSTDAGDTWVALHESEDSCYVGSIAESGGGLLFPLECETGGVVKVTHDLSVNVLSITGAVNGAADAAGCRTDGDTFFAVGRDNPDDWFSRALFKTTDGGDTWTTKTIGPDIGVFLKVKAHPYTCDVVFVAGSAGVAVSHDGGDTWAFIEGSDILLSIKKLRMVYTSGYDAVLVVAGDGGILTAALHGEEI